MVVMMWPSIALKMIGLPHDAIAIWEGAVKSPVAPQAPSVNFLVTVIFRGSMTATYDCGAGTVSRNRWSCGSHAGCSSPVASENVTLPRIWYESAEMNVAYRGLAPGVAIRMIRSNGS